MRKIDLITGFLGAGKTTFIRKYAAYLMEQGVHIGILENDFGAVNVDMMLLQDLEGELCDLEMIAGGCDGETHRRRFRTKLIAMAMSGCERVIVEPSGIYDVDEFFDVLHDEPLDSWYEIGNVIAVVDAKLPDELSPEAEYLLAAEAANAGAIVLSRSQEVSEEQRQAVTERLNRLLEGIKCSRRLKDEVFSRNWEKLTGEDFEKLSSCGYVAASYEKSVFADGRGFDSLFFMEARMTPEELQRAAREILEDASCGHVFRVKGFLAAGDGFLELNATRQGIELKPVERGQEILIVIGEGLQKKAIEGHLFSGTAKSLGAEQKDREE